MLKKEDYIKLVRRPYPPLLVFTLFLGQCKFEYQAGLFDSDVSMCNILKIEHNVYYLKSEVKRAEERIVNYWIKPGILKSIREELEKRERDLLKALDSDLETFFLNYEKYAPALAVAYCGESVAEEARKRLQNKLSKEKVDWFMDKLNTPLKDNLHKKFEYDLVTTDNIKNHVKNYEWIHSRYGEIIPYTEEEAQEKLKQIDKKEFLENWQKEKEELKKIIKEAKEILGPKEENVVDLMQFVIFYRTHRTDVLNKAVYLYRDKLKSYAAENNLTYEDFLYCTKDEVFNKEFPTGEVLKERQKDHVIVMQKGEISCLIRKEAGVVKEIFKDNLGEVKELRGDIASRGFVKGSVKVVWNRGDFNKVENGNVLVTSMTTPEMVPIMKKACAFITDEGGITCHAAIVARELKKPCIIGTKIATKVLKDGDLVEVDAERGVVKIIKNE